MADFYEIDFLKVGDTKSGDAICLRYEQGGANRVHVVDGGYKDTGQTVVDHLQSHYGTSIVDHVVATHPDNDHASGLQAVLENCQVGALWMNRPWIHAYELLPRFNRYTNADNLRAELRRVFPYLASLEDLATKHGIPIYDAFQGAQIGAFKVLGPTKARFLDCVVECDRTPAAAKTEASAFDFLMGALVGAVKIVSGAWGAETFPANDTTPRNAMSITQTALLSGTRIVLTADTGRAGLREAADYAEAIGIPLPIVGRMQVPHHGSRHNVDSETLDRWLGPKVAKGTYATSTAIVSAAANDESHPRKVVSRGFIHRGCEVLTTKKAEICCYGGAAPVREGWSAATPVPYPDDYEDL